MRYDADRSRSCDFNPNCPGAGVHIRRFADGNDSGYPVLFFLQSYNEFYRSLPACRSEPHIHGMLVYGYLAYEGVGHERVLPHQLGQRRNITYNWSTMPG